MYLDRLERILAMVYVVQSYWETVSETLWDFLSSTYKTMDKVQNKPNSSVQYVFTWKWILRSWGKYSCFGPGFDSWSEGRYSKVFISSCRQIVSYQPMKSSFHILPNSQFSHLTILQPRQRSRYSDWLRAGRQRGRSSSTGTVKNFPSSTSTRPALGPT
jgi:hypothetical protein